MKKKYVVLILIIIALISLIFILNDDIYIRNIDLQNQFTLKNEIGIGNSVISNYNNSVFSTPESSTSNNSQTLAPNIIDESLLDAIRKGNIIESEKE